MNNQIKRDINSRARLAYGLLNLLKDDIELVVIDARDYNLFTIGDSIKEAKDTLQKLVDDLTELEYLIYLTKKE